MSFSCLNSRLTKVESVLIQFYFIIVFGDKMKYKNALLSQNSDGVNLIDLNHFGETRLVTSSSISFEN